MMAENPKTKAVSIPLTPEEIKIVNMYRQLRPRDTMKIAKNQDGNMITITVENHTAVRVEFNLPPKYDIMGL